MSEDYLYPVLVKFDMVIIYGCRYDNTKIANLLVWNFQF